MATTTNLDDYLASLGFDSEATYNVPENPANAASAGVAAFVREHSLNQVTETKRRGGFVMAWAEGFGLIECKEIVFCKDCKGYRSGDPCGWCNTHMTAIPREDGFCAWGKRREE